MQVAQGNCLVSSHHIPFGRFLKAQKKCVLQQGAPQWFDMRRNVKNTFSLANSGCNGFSFLNPDFFLKAENMVPALCSEMLLFIRKLERKPGRGRTRGSVLSSCSSAKRRAGSAHACPCPRPAAPHSLLARLPLPQPCWEHGPRNTPESVSITAK